MRYVSVKLGEKMLLKSTPSFRFLKLGIKSWSIVFFGSDFYSLFCLQNLHNEMKNNSISHIEVVVVHDKTPVYEYSVSNNIKTHFWPPTLNGPYDFGVVVSFGKLIPKRIIEQFPLGLLNVHASLLPKYRGGMPVTHAIKNGESLTGVTVSKIGADKFDVGEVILQKTCLIGENELMPSLYKRLTHLGCKCLLEVISDFPKYMDNSFPQSNEGVSYAPRLKKDSAVVKWSEMTALEVFNLHRALFGLFELTTTWQEKPVKFVCLSLADSNSHMSVDVEKPKPEPGSFTYNKKTKFLYVQCKDKPITVCTLKYNGKMYTAASFQRGYVNSLKRAFWRFKS